MKIKNQRLDIIRKLSEDQVGNSIFHINKPNRKYLD